MIKDNTLIANGSKISFGLTKAFAMIFSNHVAPNRITAMVIQKKNALLALQLPPISSIRNRAIKNTQNNGLL